MTLLNRVVRDGRDNEPLGNALSVTALSSATQLGSFQGLGHRVLSVLHRVVHSEERGRVSVRAYRSDKAVIWKAAGSRAVRGMRVTCCCLE